MQKKRMRILSLLCTLMCFFCWQNLSAQQRSVSGTVTDESGEALIGVSISVKGAATGTVTDLDGKYTLSVPSGATTLEAKYIGMKTKEVPISGTVIDIVLEEDHSELDEVVVIGYGTVKKRDLTGSVSSISDKALKDIPVSSAAEAITGRMAGVHVTATEGSPDADIRIRVRGGTSISQDNSPLYVVDGIIVDNMNEIPPSDIASIDILKDASSTAIYGAKGSNGVVLITTKSGREGKISVTLNASIGAKQPNKFIDVLSPYEYVYYQYELDQTTSFQNAYGRFQDLDIYKADPGIDWQDRLFGNTGVQQYYNVGISGGSKGTVYSLSLTRNDEDYIMLNSGYNRNSLNFKVNTKMNENLSFDFNVRLTDERIYGPSISSGSGANTKLRNAVKYRPTKGLAAFDPTISDDDDQAGIGASSLLNNPVEDIENEYKKQHKFTNAYTGTLKWKIIDNLQFNSNWNYTFRNRETQNVWTKGTGVTKNYGGQPVGKITDRKGYSWTISNTLNYGFKLNQIHDFNVMLGQEVTSNNHYREKIMEARYFPVDFTAKEVLAAMSTGKAEPLQTFNNEPYNMASFFGRINYSLMDKYLFTFTARQDGASVFGPGLYWGFFPGGAFAWRMSEEEFLKSQNHWLDNMKLRLSYGAVGNANVDPYWRQTYSMGTSSVFYPNEEPVSIGTPATTLKSNGLTWETTYSTNVGIDFGLFNSRISGSIDWYSNTTNDLIVAVPLPSTSGYSQQYQNVAKTRNTGLEFSVNAYIIDNKDFTLSGNFNISFNKNKVIDYPGEQSWYSSDWNGMAQPKSDYFIQEGKPLGQMYGYISDGMYTFDDFNWDATRRGWVIKDGVANTNALISANNYFGPGALKLKKLADDGTMTVNENDKTVIGNALPKHTGGFGFNARYKGFDASIFFNWSYGNDIYNANKLDNSAYLLTRKNQNLAAFMSLDNRFTTIDPATGNNIYYGNNANPDLLRELNQGKNIWHPIMTTTVLHSWAIEDGSFLRLNNLTIGYTLPRSLTQKLRIESLRIYGTGYNLYCWTNYSGPDPEVSTRLDSPFTPGVDYSAYPKAKTFVGGINVTF